MRSLRAVPVLLCSLVLSLVATTPAAAYQRPGLTVRLSESAQGEQGNHESTHSAISHDGRFVAFASQSSNLVPGDTNGSLDIFVRDLVGGTIERASVSSTGVQSDRNSFNRPAISPDGRFVAFQSLGTNLAPGGGNGSAQIFLRDRARGTTERISIASDGAMGNGISSQPAISADGRFVVFQSQASNLVPDDTNATYDVFVRDRVEGTTERVSVSTDGAAANAGMYDSPAISADGRYVAFATQASNLVADDTNAALDVFVRDRAAGTTRRISVSSAGAQGDDHSYAPTMSADGRTVAFISRATTLIPSDANYTYDIFLRDIERGTTERVALTAAGRDPNAESYYPSISADGSVVAFVSEASNLVPGDTNGRSDIFVRNRVTDTTERISASLAGGASNERSGSPSLSGDGRVVSFQSFASNLVPGDTNGRGDVFVRDRGPALGLGGLTARVENEGVAVSGWSTFSGATISAATDAEDVLPVTGLAGSDIARARVVHRPEDEDLLLRIDLAALPSRDGWASPWAHFGFRFSVGATRYEVRSISGLTGSSLYRCAPDCIEQERLSGGVGTAGEDVLVAVPLAAVGALPGAQLTDVSAYTALGPPQARLDETMVDELDLPSAVVPRIEVTLGLASAETPEEEVRFDVAAPLEVGRFSRILDGRALGSGEHRVWARACLGGTCSTSFRVVEG
ncbi:MAG TPA: hypothetical protein VM638_06195 [Actinomycetota bacterium]|nr:hypothetical protein [Actinomycetota bacterium]